MRYSASTNSVTLKTGLGVVQGHWKITLFDRPYTTFYWSAIVNIALSCTVSELFDVEWYRDLENWVRGCSRSLKITPFDRPYTTFYWSAIVNIALSCTVSELFDVEWYRDLEIRVRGQSKLFKLVPFESLGAVSYSLSIATMALSCISSEIKRDNCRKSWFFWYPACIQRPCNGVPVGILPSRLVWKN